MFFMKRFHRRWMIVLGLILALISIGSGLASAYIVHAYLEAWWSFVVVLWTLLISVASFIFMGSCLMIGFED